MCQTFLSFENWRCVIHSVGVPLLNISHLNIPPNLFQNFWRFLPRRVGLLCTYIILMYCIRVWGPDAGILARTFSRSRVKIRIMCWRKHPGWLRLFFALWLLQWALMQKWSKCREKCLKEKFGHAWHLHWHQSVHCKFLLTWNHPSETKSLDSLHALYSVKVPMLIQHQPYLLFNFRNIEFGGKHVVEKALETNKTCLWYYEICKRKDMHSPPTHWKQLQLNLHLRGWLVIVFVQLHVQMSSVQHFHRQSDSGELGTEGQQCCILMLII